MACRDFQVLLETLKRCTSPLRFVFLPPIKIISVGLIAKALHAQRGF
jgi:hypothetical protein